MIAVGGSRPDRCRGVNDGRCGDEGNDDKRKAGAAGASGHVSKLAEMSRAREHGYPTMNGS